MAVFYLMIFCIFCYFIICIYFHKTSSKVANVVTPLCGLIFNGQCSLAAQFYNFLDSATLPVLYALTKSNTSLPSVYLSVKAVINYIIEHIN